MKKTVIALVCVLMPVIAGAQTQPASQGGVPADRHDVRAGNRKFRKGDFKNSEIDYRKAVVRDSLSFAGNYNLASALYRQEDFESAGKAMENIGNDVRMSGHAADYYYNLGDIALKKKDYKGAVEAFKNSLLLRPGDMDAKENYLYAKKMLDDQEQNGGGNDQNQDQDQNQNQNQDQDQNQDQNQDQDQNQNQDQNQDQQDQNQGGQPQESKISPQQAQQMLQAIQAKEKETQEKVNEKKALLLKSKQKEKNW